jgi:hypothetical protein
VVSILKADHKQKIDFLNKSRAKYWGWLQNQLVILEDGHIFIGVNADNKKQIITEDIRNDNSSEIIAQHENNVISLLANTALNIFWAADEDGNIFQYVLGPTNGWKVQAKYSDLGTILCLSLFGNLLFAGGADSKVFIINIADKKVLPMEIKTAIQEIYSLKTCVISSSEIFLTVTGEGISYCDGKTDLFDISKLQEISFVKEIFSEPELHINSIYHQFHNNYTAKELSINNRNPKLNNLSQTKL